jgi:hypothetical protein
MTATGNPVDRPAITSPRPADIRLVIAGAVAHVAVLFAGFIPEPTPFGQFGYLVAVVFGTLLVSAVLAVPAYLLRGRRGDWRGFTVWMGKGLLVLAGFAAVGVARRTVHDSTPPLLASLKTGEVSIHGFLRAERAAAPALFDQRLLTRHGQALKQFVPGISDVSLAGVTDNDDWVRAHITYAATLEKSATSAKAHMVVYYHASGMAAIGAMCPPDEDCQPLEGLLNTAEQGLRTHLRESGLHDVLPQSGACSIEAFQPAHSPRRTDVRACAYDSGIQLTLTRLGAADTIDALIAERTPR